MASVNSQLEVEAPRTHEGAIAVRVSKLAELRRTVLASLLWEQTFYEGGAAHATRLAALVAACRPEDVAALAVEARDRMYLRHVPVFLVRELARTKGNGTLVADTLARVVQRPDELTEYLALYWLGKASGTSKRPEPLSAGSKRGLARAFAKFRPETLAKYDRDGAVKLRDVLRIVHASPKTTEQSTAWRQVVERTLAAPDTWEVALSAGADKRETFERLLREERLGGLAFLRNLRNMIEAGVDADLIRARFGGNFDKVLPFRFISAVRHAPAFADNLNAAMLRAIADEAKLVGKTAVVVDVSGSMNNRLSEKSEVTRMDVAAGLAVLVRELCDDCRVFAFSDSVAEVAAYRGLALVGGIIDSMPHGSTYLDEALTAISKVAKFDRVIVITDEQSHDRVQAPKAGLGYVVNVATNEHGVGYGKWTHIDGWSERILDFVREIESDVVGR